MVSLFVRGCDCFCLCCLLLWIVVFVFSVCGCRLIALRWFCLLVGWWLLYVLVCFGGWVVLWLVLFALDFDLLSWFVGLLLLTCKVMFVLV